MHLFEPVRRAAGAFYAVRKKHPLLFFICGRVVTMFLILFVLGFAIFALMELAPGDIVDQLMTQQLLAGASGGASGRGVDASGRGDTFLSEAQIAAQRAELGLDKPFYARRKNMCVQSQIFLKRNRAVFGEQFHLHAEKPYTPRLGLHAGTQIKCLAAFALFRIFGGQIRALDL